MKFAHLIEYNMTNISVEKSHSKCAGETILGPLPKKLKLSISMGQWYKVLNNLFPLYANLRAIEI